jgi:hypothetical protein
MNWLLALWTRFWPWALRRPSRLRLMRVAELPDRLERHRLYVEADNAWLAAMLCPCGCGETLHMSLLAGDRPRWDLIEHKDGTVSLYPSVWRRGGCRSHFFLTRSRIKWCP